MTLVSSVHVKFRSLRSVYYSVWFWDVLSMTSFLTCSVSSQEVSGWKLMVLKHTHGTEKVGMVLENTRRHPSIMFPNYNKQVTIRLMIGHSISFEIHPKSKAFFKIDSCISRGVWCLISSDFLLHSMEDPAQLTLWKLVRSLNFWRTRRQEVNWKFLRL